MDRSKGGAPQIEAAEIEPHTGNTGQSKGLTATPEVWVGPRWKQRPQDGPHPQRATVTQPARAGPQQTNPGSRAGKHVGELLARSLAFFLSLPNIRKMSLFLVKIQNSA